MLVVLATRFPSFRRRVTFKDKRNEATANHVLEILFDLKQLQLKAEKQCNLSTGIRSLIEVDWFVLSLAY